MPKFLDLLAGALLRIADPETARAARELRATMQGGGGLVTQAEGDNVAKLIALMQMTESGGTAGNLPMQISDYQARQYFWGWQYAASCLIAEGIMQAPWVVEVKMGKGKWEAAEGHELGAAWEFGNPVTSGALLRYYTSLDLSMIGKHWWVIAPNSLNGPGEFWPLLGIPTPIRDKDPQVYLRGWQYTDPETRQAHTYPVNEIVFFRFPEPGNLLDGMGIFQAAGGSIRMGRAITESEWTAIKKSVWPSALLRVPSQDADKRDEIKREFDAKTAGAKHTGESIVTSNNVDVQWPPWKPREMGFPQGREWTRDETLALHRTPAAMFGLSKDVNRAVVDALGLVYAKWTLTPKLFMLSDQFNRQVSDRFYPRGTVRLRFENIVPQDMAEERARDDMELGRLVISGNDYLRKYGREGRPWGETPIASITVAPLGSAPLLPPEGGQSLASVPLRTEQAARRGYSRETRRTIAAESRVHQTQLGEQIRRKFARYFGDLEARVLAAWDEVHQSWDAGDRATQGLPVPIDKVLTRQVLMAEIASRLRDTNRKGIIFGGDFARSLAPNPDDYVWTGESEAVDRYLAKFGASYYGEIADTTRTRIAETVAEGVRKQETWDELRLRIVDEFGAMKESRAANIATTETTRIYGAGGQAFMDDAGVEQKQWCCSFVNSRETHIEADGQIVNVDEPFAVGADTMQYPGDGRLASENCNYSCVVTPFFKKPE